MWFRKSFPVTRTMRDGTTSEITITADVQPSNDTSIGPLGVTDRAIRIYTDDEIFPSNQPPSQEVKKDELTYNSRVYKVVKVVKYDGGVINHYEGIAVSYDLQEVTIYKPVRQSDGMGGYEDTEEEIATVKARIGNTKASVAQGMTGGMTTTTGSMMITTQTITISDETPIDLTCQLEYKGERYEIMYIDRSHYDVLILTVQKVLHRG